jgi:molybdate transport system substrate-binding protein
MTSRFLRSHGSRIRVRLALAALCASAACAGLTMPAGADSTAPTKRTLTVYAAASLSDAFNEMGRAIEARTPGLKIDFNFAGSQQLAAQIEQGASADVFASADSRWMQYLAGLSLLAGADTTFARARFAKSSS